MSYPKPLSQKSLAKLYESSGLKKNEIVFLHDLFAACANLYGAIAIRDVWSIYQALQDVCNYPKIKRKDIIAFSSIVRREVQPYYIYEIDEMYSEEKRTDLDRMIITSELIGSGYGWRVSFYRLEESLGDQPFYISKELLEYKEKTRSKEEQALLDHIGNLTSTSDVCTPKYGMSYPSENKGKKLKDFTFLNRHEQFEKEYLSNKPAQLAEYMKQFDCSEAEKIVDSYMFWTKEGYIDLGKEIEFVFDELTEAGVELTAAQAEEIVQLLQDCHNNTHLWCIRGWKPVDLMKARPIEGPLTVSFGSNMQKMFEDGRLNKDELISELRRMGIDVEEH